MSQTMMRKAREQWQIERFRAICPVFPKGDINPCEKPDFLVEDDAGVIGIELTELYRTTPADQLPMQVSESLANRVVQQAQTIYEERGGAVLWVSVAFGIHAKLQKNHVSELAYKLANIIINTDITPDEYIRVENDYFDTDFFPEDIASIHIRKLNHITEGFWSVPTAAFIPDCSSGEIQQIIDKKNILYPSYRKKCQEAWLVVVHEVSLSSTFKFSDEVLNHSYSSLFERTFLYGNFSPSALELNGGREGDVA
ncbi:MAG: hypothetical protein MSG64_00085 [Pyrinomonadaceae bacterium MAG19_C2-C3]|nr:hypothetical protein [Pyrinomonadaceae bacterium MAG19_C2-C3]